MSFRNLWLPILLLLSQCQPQKSEEEVVNELKKKIGPDKKIVRIGSGVKTLPELQDQAEKNPKDFQAQYDFAVLALKSHQTDLALQAAERAYQLQPDSNAAREIYAYSLQGAQKLDQAAELWKQIVASGQPYSKMVDNNLGIYLKMQNQFDEAEASFRKALEPPDPIILAYPNLADLQIKKGDLDGAKDTLAQGLKLFPSMQFAHHQLGRIAFQQNDFEVAAAEFDLELQVRPTASESLYLQALAYGRMKTPQVDKAAASLQKVQAARPGDEGYYKAILADLWIDAGQPAKAIEVATEALGEIPAFEDAQRNVVFHALAKAYFKQGNVEKAREFYQMFQQSVHATDAHEAEQRRRIHEMDSMFGDHDKP